MTTETTTHDFAPEASTTPHLRTLTSGWRARQYSCRAR